MSSTTTVLADGKVQLHTSRLLLRAATLSDVEALHNVFSDAEAMRYWSEPPHANLTRTREWVSSMTQSAATNGITDFVICLKPSLQVIGKMGVWEAGGDEIGFILARPLWRRGLASEALRTVLEYLFCTARGGFESLSADVDPRNQGSLAILEAFGFVIEREEKGTLLVGEEWVDSVYLRLGKERWEGLSLDGGRR